VKGASQSAVAVLIDTKTHTGFEDTHLLLTQRSEDVETHKGHFAFPGGLCDADELREPTGKVRTAIRELKEEVGIEEFLVEVIGELPELDTLSGFRIMPVVAILKKPREEVNFAIQTSEVSLAFWCPFSQLIQCRSEETFRLSDGKSAILPVFLLPQGRVWGATAIIIDNLLQRIRA